ncbi:MAG: hypothetical protein RL291_1075 [Pseudomonadota bacterium]
MATAPIAPAKRGYHHGDLREALIASTRQLLTERGVDGFSLTDACRAAGVSTAAPYKHFRDKQEILREVVKLGFDQLRESSVAACAAAGRGTLSGVVALGHAYLRFAVGQPAVFRLMFGHHAAVSREEHVVVCGQNCFGAVAGEIELYCRAHNPTADPRTLALELWTFVHGAASLKIDEDYDKVSVGLDVEAMIQNVTPRILSGRSA